MKEREEAVWEKNAWQGSVRMGGMWRSGREMNRPWDEPITPALQVMEPCNAPVGLGFIAFPTI